MKPKLKLSKRHLKHYCQGIKLAKQHIIHSNAKTEKEVLDELDYLISVVKSTYEEKL